MIDQRLFEIIVDSFGKILLPGLTMTIPLTAISFFFALIIALIVAMIQFAHVRVLRQVARFYVWVIRGTPLLVQLFVVFYGMPNIGILIDPFPAAVIVFSINEGAYMAEIIRSGLQSVDKGQSEAAKSIGLTSLQTLIYIIFPQAIRNAFPSIGNQLIVNIKDSSMLNVVWVIELFTQSRAIAGSNYRPVETYFVAAVIYLILTTVATLVLNFIERKMAIESKSRDLCA